MAVELEQTVMMEIGLGNHYGWFNGSGSCGYIRADAVNKFQSVAQKHGLSISSAWLKRCHEAITVDECDGQKYSLTNTWITCSYAIQDAIYRKESGKGFNPPPLREDWHFFSDNGRQAYERSGNRSGFFGDERDMFFRKNRRDW